MTERDLVEKKLALAETYVDLEVVRDVVEHRLDDLLAFVTAVRRRSSEG